MLTPEQSLKAYPERLHRKNRPVTEVYPFEKLYYRLNPEALHRETGKLDTGYIGVARTSSNRSTLSEPPDVLIEQPDWLIYYWDVPKVTAEVPATDLSTKPEHIPEDWNYAHAEVRAYQAGEERKNIGNKVKNLALKQFLANHLTPFAETEAAGGADSPEEVVAGAQRSGDVVDRESKGPSEECSRGTPLSTSGDLDNSG